MKPPNRLKNVYITTVIFALIVGAGAWYFLATQQPTLEVVPELSSYFKIDEPKVEVHLKNPLNADSGKVTLMYPDNILNVITREAQEGVTIREVDNTFIFTLSKNYFDLQESRIATLTFESTDIGSALIEFDKERTNLQANGQIFENLNFIDSEIAIGISSTDEPVELERNPGTFKEI